MKFGDIKIDRAFKYAEVRKDKTTIEFGWQELDAIDETQPGIVSYPSRSKFASKEKMALQKKIGNVFVSVSDYEKYILASTGETPQGFLDGKSDDFVGEGLEQILFLISKLILTKKKFIIDGQGFRYVEAKGANEEGEV